jgi:hypothetical protein
LAIWQAPKSSQLFEIKRLSSSRTANKHQHLRWGDNPTTPAFLEKSVESLDAKRLALHYLLKGRKESTRRKRSPPLPHHFGRISKEKPSKEGSW